MAPPALRGVLQFTTILFLAGSALLLFFIVLAGSKSDGVLHKWYWLAADTSSIENSKYPISRWSMYGLCGYEKGESVKHPGNFISCTKNKADYPLDLKRNFGLSADSVWEEFQSNKFYYETRFQFPFYLIALFFDVVALFSSVFSIFSTISFVITSASIFLTAIFTIIAASLSTAAYVGGRNAFHSNGVDAAIAPSLYGFAWAVVFMALVNVVLIFLGFSPKKNNSSSYKIKSSSKGTPAGKRGGFKFGTGKKKTTVVDDKDASSFVRG